MAVTGVLTLDEKGTYGRGQARARQGEITDKGRLVAIGILPPFEGYTLGGEVTTGRSTDRVATVSGQEGRLPVSRPY